MTELILYAILFAALSGHCLFAGKMYRIVHEDSSLSFREKNDWKFKALLFPAWYWFQYQKNKQQ